jgi:hypothetical protein
MQSANTSDASTGWLSALRRTIAGMSDSIFLVGPDGSLTEALSAGFSTEAELQKLLAEHIHLLPGAQMNQGDPRRWLLIKREAGVPDREGGGGWWAIDHLAVDQDATPTFIEVKRASDTRSRREVVAQMLDYAANGSVYWTPGLLRGWFEQYDPDSALERLAQWLDPAAADPGALADDFWQRVGTNLREGHIRLVFVADEIPASLQRLVEFLNEQMPRVEVLALEIRRYQASSNSTGALVPRLVGHTARAQAAKEQTTAQGRRPNPWTTAEVLETAAQAGNDAAAVAEAVCQWATSHPHLRITGGRGLHDRSLTILADTGRPTAPLRGVLQLYAASAGRPLLEVRIQQLCQIPPYNHAEAQGRLTDSLRGLGITSLATESAASKRPNIPLGELTLKSTGRLLSVIGQWIDDVRAHPTGPEKAGRSPG